MNKQDIFTLISSHFGIEIDEIDMDSEFVEDFNCNHTDMVELKLILEDLIKTKVDKEEFEEIESVDDLFALLENYNTLDEL